MSFACFDSLVKEFKCKLEEERDFLRKINSHYPSVIVDQIFRLPTIHKTIRFFIVNYARLYTAQELIDVIAEAVGVSDQAARNYYYKTKNVYLPASNQE